MKNTLNKLFATGLLAAVLVGAAWAQGGSSTSPATNPPTEMERRMALDKLDNERHMALDKLETEKNIAINRDDKRWSILHDFAWNSWVLMVIAIFFFGYLKNKRRHETIRLMVEKGAPITPEVLAALGRRRRRNAFGVVQDGDNRASHDPNGYLAWGITLVAVGIGVKIVAGNAGYIVLLIGVADLILWVIERLSSNRGQSSK